jgi:large subunit ribosomal protein L3
VKVARHAEAPYPAGLKGANSNEEPEAIETPVEETAAIDAAEGSNENGEG